MSAMLLGISLATLYQRLGGEDKEPSPKLVVFFAFLARGVAYYTGWSQLLRPPGE